MDWIYWIIITFVVFALMAGGIVAYRFRQYIQTGLFMLKAYRQFKQSAKPEKKSIETKAVSGNSPLVKCAKCEKWFSQEQGVKLKTSYFCSHNCLEESFTARG